VESNTFKIHSQFFNLLDVIKQAFMLVGHVAEEKNIKLQTNYNCDVELFKRICGDERRYLQILINFLSNAIKFSHKDSNIVVGLKLDEVTAKTEVMDDDDPKDLEDLQDSQSEEQIVTIVSKQQILYVSFDLTIQDFGYGMSPESANKIFIDFAKMEEHATVNTQGVGLGLSICKTLIEQMAGSVKVESQQGKGTLFSIKFRTTCKITENFLTKDCPKYFANESMAQRQRSIIVRDLSDSSMMESDESMLRSVSIVSRNEPIRPNILIANDSWVILYGLEDLLAPSFNVVRAENGFEAVDRVKEKPRDFFDAIVLDIQMPIMNGLEACVLIREYCYQEGITQVISRPSCTNLMDDSNDTIRDIFSPRQVLGWKQSKRPIIYCFTGNLDSNILD